MTEQQINDERHRIASAGRIRLTHSDEGGWPVAAPLNAESQADVDDAEEFNRLSATIAPPSPEQREDLKA